MSLTSLDPIFSGIALLLLVAAGMGALSLWLRQPLVLGYIFVGILVGPSMLGWVIPRDQIDLLARMGIAMLLFVVGLKLDLHLIRTLGPVALATGSGAGPLHIDYRLLPRLGAGVDSCCCRLRGRRPNFLQHDHHREASLGQTRDCNPQTRREPLPGRREVAGAFSRAFR